MPIYDAGKIQSVVFPGEIYFFSKYLLRTWTLLTILTSPGNILVSKKNVFLFLTWHSVKQESRYLDHEDYYATCPDPEVTESEMVHNKKIRFQQKFLLKGHWQMNRQIPSTTNELPFLHLCSGTLLSTKLLWEEEILMHSIWKLN